MLYIASSGLIYFVTRCLYLLVTFTHFTRLPPPPLATTKPFSVSMSLVLNVFFFFFFRIPFIFLCLTYPTQHSAHKVHPCCGKWQDPLVIFLLKPLQQSCEKGRGIKTVPILWLKKPKLRYITQATAYFFTVILCLTILR